MNLVFRADASLRMGSGHVMRCLTIARSLARAGARSTFVCRAHAGHLGATVERAGFSVKLLPVAEAPADEWLGASREQDAVQTLEALGVEDRADWLIVDHYSLDEVWEHALRPSARRLMVIDDLANRRHDCDLILDQNFYLDMESRYDSLTPAHCFKALGPAYALLRPEFYEKRPSARRRDGRVRRVLLSFGGVDAADDTSKAIVAARAVSSDLDLDVIVPPASPHRARIFERFGGQPRIALRENVERMAELMDAADLAIGAGGATTWERCYLGLPTITLVVAENQRQANTDLATTGVIRNLGWHADVSEQALAQTIRELIDEPEQLVAMSNKALELMPAVEGIEPAVTKVLRNHS